MASITSACRLDPSEIDFETSLWDLDMDSLTLVSVIAQVEALYAVALTADDTSQLLQCARICDLLAGLEQAIARRSDP